MKEMEDEFKRSDTMRVYYPQNEFSLAKAYAGLKGQVPKQIRRYDTIIEDTYIRDLILFLASKNS